MAAPTVTTTAPSGILAEAATGGGEVTNAGVTARTNAITNPRPVHTANALPSGWAGSGLAGTTVTYSDGAVQNGITSKHIKLVGGSGSYNYAGIICRQAVAAETAPGDVWTFSCLIGEGTFSGCTLTLAIDWWTSANAYISEVLNTPFAPGAGFTLYSVTATAPANAARISCVLQPNYNFSNGDTQEYSVCEVLIEKAASAGTYFDGTVLGYWTGTANASASVCDGITARGVCWGPSANPTTADSKTDDHSHATPGNVSTFTSAIAGLTPGAVYHARAYAVNADGTSYGADAPFAAHSSNLPVIGCAFIKGGRQCQ